MKGYTCTTFKGHFPVGTAAVVIAKGRRIARTRLSRALKVQGLPGLSGKDRLEEIRFDSPGVYILADGDF